MRRRAPRLPCGSSSHTAWIFPASSRRYKGRVERPLFQVQKTAPGLVQSPEDLQPVGLASLQDRQDHRFQMAPQLVTFNRFHAVILDSLVIGVKRVEANGRLTRTAEAAEAGSGGVPSPAQPG